MKPLKDIREVFDPNFAPHSRIKEIENVQLGDLPARTIQDIEKVGGAKPPNRSQIVTPTKEV